MPRRQNLSSKSWLTRGVKVEFDQNLLARKGEAASTTLQQKANFNPAKPAPDPSE
jgi:hypothetical protein